MSIPVDVARLAAVLADFDAGYLLTTRDGRVKAVTVEPEPAPDGTLRIAAPGGGTLANLAANDAVTLVLPPRAPRGFTLLVDGTAAADGDAGDDVVLTPASAVLHRPRIHADGPPPPPSAGDEGA
ncbi:hypothetical protein GCM10023340_16530 [Nocardioides marinquilinus]|uniref:Pyridoxamine 5'-phosphate oxidase n=1 Tax=Nocardioides marinquilinus TaxID=1210400 RepID=A0ABP9PJY2_9ACTN